MLLIDTKRFNTEEYARYPKEISNTPCYNNFHNGMPYYDRSLGDVCKDPDQHYYYDTRFVNRLIYKDFAAWVFKQLHAILKNSKFC